MLSSSFARDHFPKPKRSCASFVETRLSRPMVPEAVHIVADLPRTSAGKIDRERLRWIAESGNKDL